MNSPVALMVLPANRNLPTVLSARRAGKTQEMRRILRELRIDGRVEIVEYKPRIVVRQAVAHGVTGAGGVGAAGTRAASAVASADRRESSVAASAAEIAPAGRTGGTPTPAAAIAAVDCSIKVIEA